MLRQIKERLRALTGSPETDALAPDLTPTERELIARIRAQRLSYLSNAKLSSLVRTCRSIDEAGLPGRFLEAGCALGGSAILIASLKRAERPFAVYDVFEMIPPPTADDTPDVHQRYQTIVEGKSRGLGGDKYYGYLDNLYEVVQTNLRNFGIDLEGQSVSLVKGRVEETMTIADPVALAHVDVDWYQPVRTCLERVFPHLVEGGSIILDDYHDWGGCRKATDEFLQTVAGQFALDDSAGSMKVTRLKG